MHRAPTACSAILLNLLLSSHSAAQDPAYTTFGTGCAGSVGVPLLEADADSLPIFGGTFRAKLSNVPDGAAIGILGLSKTTWLGQNLLPLDLALINMPGCTLYTDPRRTTVLFPAGGSAIWNTALPGEPTFLGQSFFQQALVLDISVPGLGAVMSNAAEGVIGIAGPGAPVATIAFPPASSATDEDTILVRGSATDPDGIAEVRVNDLLATTSDGFANWQIRVPISLGSNTLNVETTDMLGERNPRATSAQIESLIAIHFPEPQGVAIDAVRNRALIADTNLEAILALDLTTRERSVISSESKGIGPLFNPLGMAVDGDRALVTGVGQATIFAVDLATGNRRIFSDTETGNGPRLGRPWDLALDGTRALVTDPAQNTIFAVDLATGNRSVLSSNSRGTGVQLQEPIGIALDGTRALVADQALMAVLAVDLTSGDRSVISNAFTGSGPNFRAPFRIALDGTRALVTDPSRSAVFAVDLGTGDRTIISDSETGFGKSLGIPRGIAVDGNHALVGGAGALFNVGGALFSIDLATGNRTVLSHLHMGTGPQFEYPSRTALDGNRLLVTDMVAHVIIAVDLATGNRRVFSGAGIGSGPELFYPRDIVMDGNRALVVEQTLQAILAVDLDTGDRSVISDSFHGTGFNLQEPTGIALDGARALVTEPRQRAIVSVDLATGNRSFVSSDFTGTGRRLAFPTNIVVHGSQALVLNSSTILSVDLATGNRTVISSATVGTGPEVRGSGGLAIDGPRALAPIHRQTAEGGAIVAVDLATLNRTMISDRDTGTGPVFSPRSIDLLDGYAIVPAIMVESSQAGILAIDVQTGERVVISK